MSSAPALQSMPSPTAFSAVYEEHFSFLCDVARYRFNVPEDEAEDVVQEVFLSFLLVRDTVREARAWLIGGVCNASRRYWMLRGGGREENLPQHAAAPQQVEKLMQEISVRQVVGRLHPKCRRTLRLHYWDGATAREVATRLDTTNRYAEKLIHKCLRQAWRAWHHLWRKS